MLISEGSAAHGRDDAKIKKVHKLTVVVCYCSTDSKRRDKSANHRVEVTLRHAPVFLFPLSSAGLSGQVVKL